MASELRDLIRMLGGGGGGGGGAKLQRRPGQESIRDSSSGAKVVDELLDVVVYCSILSSLLAFHHF